MERFDSEARAESPIVKVTLPGIFARFSSFKTIEDYNQHSIRTSIINDPNNVLRYREETGTATRDNLREAVEEPWNYFEVIPGGSSDWRISDTKIATLRLTGTNINFSNITTKCFYEGWAEDPDDPGVLHGVYLQGEGDGGYHEWMENRQETDGTTTLDEIIIEQFPDDEQMFHFKFPYPGLNNRRPLPSEYGEYDYTGSGYITFYSDGIEICTLQVSSYARNNYWRYFILEACFMYPALH